MAVAAGAARARRAAARRAHHCCIVYTDGQQPKLRLGELGPVPVPLPPLYFCNILCMYPSERERLLSLLRAWPCAVFVVSGDRHYSELAQECRWAAAALILCRERARSFLLTLCVVAERAESFWRSPRAASTKRARFPSCSSTATRSGLLGPQLRRVRLHACAHGGGGTSATVQRLRLPLAVPLTNTQDRSVFHSSQRRRRVGRLDGSPRPRCPHQPSRVSRRRPHRA